MNFNLRNMTGKKYCAIYLSGTGNTKFCVEKFVTLLDEHAPVFAIEEEATLSALKNYEYVVLGYPVQYSNAPKMVREFIVRNAALWKGKNIFCLGWSAHQNARQRLRQ